ncbi:MAG: AzlC family ABC transporter permease [Halolamina sp.]
MSRRSDFVAGVRTVAPVTVGIAPFGLVAGVAAVEADLGVDAAMGFSTVVFAGASQLAAIELLAGDASLPVVVATALVINARMLMYSASIAPHFEGSSGRVRALAAYLLTDQAYALSVVRFREDGTSMPYYLGVASPLWVVWVCCTLVGAVVGARLPAWLPLGFAVPLTFLAILVPAVEDRPSVVAAVVGGAVAVVGAGLPFNLGLLGGGVSGILAGLAAEVTE